MTAPLPSTVQTEVDSYFEAGKKANARVVGLAESDLAGSNYKQTLPAQDGGTVSTTYSTHVSPTTYVEKAVESESGGAVNVTLSFGATTVEEFHTVLQMVSDGLANVAARAETSSWRDHDAPTFTTMADTVVAGAGAATVEITKALVAAQGNEADDGSVAAFVVQALTAGTLTIGADVETATAFAAGTNDTIDADNNAYWTIPAGAAGDVDAFTIKAMDNDGWLSATAIQLKVERT